MALQYLVEIVKHLDPVIDPIEAEVEETEAIERHLHAMGWDAWRLREEEPEKERMAAA